ncbi:MAG TPA: NUDIX domain-containing protein [Candidatus Kapabacteria bacterium]|nr:NUDIX domain-containing protein [Candidatus Kapabacteria bacterium]
MHSTVPHAVCAGGVVLRKEGNHWYVALEQQLSYEDTGCWFIPKGHVEKGEDLETAARREITEEVGVSSLQRVEYIGKKERLSIRGNEWKEIYYFLFTTEQTELHPEITKEKHAAKWFDLYDPNLQLFFPEQNEVLEVVRGKMKHSLPSGNKARNRAGP